MDQPFRRGVCWELTINDMGWKIQLIQQGKDRFTVKYGLSEKKDLDYSKAAKELGACLMHHLACENKLDNREKHEKD